MRNQPTIDRRFLEIDRFTQGLLAWLSPRRLTQSHGSVPHNLLLAEPLYLTQYIERMGTGTGDMIRRCREAGLREPECRIADGFSLTLWRTKDMSVAVAPSGKPSAEMSGKMSGKIVRLMQEKPDITIPELAQRLKRTERTIERQINKLKADEIIGRIGPAKGGHWEVLK